jgi:anti-anti-sigma factor
MLIQAPSVITLTTDYDVYTTPQLEAELNRVVDVRDVVIDFSYVSYIDSTAIGALIRLHKRRLQRGLPSVRFAALPKALRRVLTIVSLDRVWPWYEDVAAAVSSFA